MAGQTDTPSSGDIWHLTIDDLLAPLPETIRLGGAGPFVINLSASSAPIVLPVKGFAGGHGAHLYQVQRTEDRRVRYRLRLGPFATEDEADAVLKKVRDDYPSALTATADADDLRAIAALPSPRSAVPHGSVAPPITAAPRAGTVAPSPAARPAGSDASITADVPVLSALQIVPVRVAAPASELPAPKSAGTAIVAPMRVPAAAIPVLRAPAATPPPVAPVEAIPAPRAPAAAPRPPVARIAAAPAPAAPALAAPAAATTAPRVSVAAIPAPRVPVAATPARQAPVAAAPRAPVTTIPAPRAPAAAAPAPSAPAARHAEPARRVPTLESTQTVRALTQLELEDDQASLWFAIQLAVAEEAFDPETVPNLDIFTVYRLYSVAGIDQGRIVHALRLGFFTEEIAAGAVASYLAAFYDTPTIKRVSTAERERFAQQSLEPRKDVGATGKQAVIEITNERYIRERRIWQAAVK